MRTRARFIGVVASAILSLPAPAVAQQVRFDADLPRAMVFLREEGATAATILTSFLKEAGFEVVDPTFAKTAAQQETARAALAGDDVAATTLGRDLGAQVLILGLAPADAAPNPIDASLQVGTARIDVRALRLDEPRVVATGSASGRAIEATPGGARVSALRKAAESLLGQSGFLGSVVNDWAGKRWNDRAYWQPEPGSVPAQLASHGSPAGESPASASGVGIAILDSSVGPDSAATRGIVVVSRQGQLARIRGIVTDPAARVWIGSTAATPRPLSADERKRYGLGSGGALFEASVPILAGQDTVRVSAEGGSGRAAVLVRPKVDKHWAVVIGVSDYADERIRPLQFADDDARSIHQFLRSPAGGAIPEAQMRLLLNRDATAAAIRDALFVFLQQADEDDLVTIYVASHGAPDPKRTSNLYILPYDANIDALASTGFPMWDFKTAVRRQIASDRVLVIADACHSAGTLVDEANPIGGAFAELFDPSRRVTLTAASAMESSLEGAKWGGGAGVFTHTLLRGLRGEADADRDGVVTFAEAASFVEARVPQETDGRQNPKRTGFGDLPLTVLAPATHARP